MKKIGILYTDAAGGHKAAAVAMKSVFDELEVEVEMIDIFKEINIWPLTDLEKHWNTSTSSKALMSLNYLLYKITDIKIVKETSNYIFQVIFEKHVHNYLRDKNYDVIISTHFLVTVLIDGFSKAKKINLVTDLIDFPSLQATKNIDMHFCASYQAVDKLMKYGVKKENIYCEFFPNYIDIPALEKTRQVDRKTVLISGGGLGGPKLLSITKIIKEMDDIDFVIQYGKDDRSKLKFEKELGYRANVKYIGFVKNFFEYIYVSDLIITKPGPATIMEIEILNKKAIFTNPIGPQEEKNYEFILQNPNFKYFREAKDIRKKDIFNMLDEQKRGFEPRFSKTSALKIAKLIHFE